MTDVANEKDTHKAPFFTLPYLVNPVILNEVLHIYMAETSIEKFL